MKIENKELDIEDIGSKVTYVPNHANGNASHKDAEWGHIKSWNDTFIFVTYQSNTKATRPQDLVWG